MNPLPTGTFDLPDHLARKEDPALIGGDEQHFAAIAESLEQMIDDLSGRLDAERKAPGGVGQEAMDRDMEIHRLAARLRALRRFGLDLCLGHIVSADHPEPVYVGRLGLTDSAGRRLLLDWRAPAAAPFFAATHANPMGLASRRRYRWSGGRVSDYWDEVFTPDGCAEHAALDDQSAFIARQQPLSPDARRARHHPGRPGRDHPRRFSRRSGCPRRSGYGQDRCCSAPLRLPPILRPPPGSPPGRRALRRSTPALPGLRRGCPAQPRRGGRADLLRDLVAEGAEARIETDPQVTRLKSSANMVKAIEAAVKFYEEPPATGMTVTTEWADFWLSAGDWAAAFDAAEAGIAHNEARDQIRAELLTILLDDYDGEVPADRLRMSLQQDTDLLTTLNSAWPLLEAADVVADLWSVPAYLHRCAPWLTTGEVQALQRADAKAWTVSDLPLLDAAWQRLGDPELARRRRRREAAVATERQRMATVVDDLIATDDSEMLVMSMLRGQDLQGTLVDETALPSTDRDLLAGPFAHIVVDEAQELTDAEWQMLLLRCPSRSLTIVGDRSQARHGFPESWQERLERIALDRITLASLSINYRTPEPVMAQAEPVIRAVLPNADVPIPIRSSDVPVVHGSACELGSILDTWIGTHAEGVACVIGDPTFQGTPRVRSLTPELSKGLEFDLVVLVDPEAFGKGIEGAVDRYVAMTRATQRLVILTSPLRSTEASPGNSSRRDGVAAHDTMEA